MSPRTNIRLAEVRDARGIAEVHVQTWQDTYAGHMPADFLAGLSVDRREEMWTRVLSTGRDRVWVAEAGGAAEGAAEGRVVGFLAFWAEDGRLPEVRALYVLPGMQSTGVGGELMERALDRARSLDAGGVCLSVLEANSGARRFYERFGFRLVRTSRDEIAPGVEITHAHYELQWRETDAGPGPGDAVAPMVAPPTVPGSRAT